MSCVCVCVCVCARSVVTICDPMDCSPPGSSVLGISQARILQYSWSILELSFPSPMDLPDPGIEPISTGISCIAHGFFTY